MTTFSPSSFSRSSNSVYDGGLVTLPAVNRLEIRPSLTKVVKRTRYDRREAESRLPTIYEYPAYYVRLISKNGNVLMHSEGYSSRANAVRAAASIAKAFESSAMPCYIIEPNKKPVWAMLYYGTHVTVKTFVPVEEDRVVKYTPAQVSSTKVVGQTDKPKTYVVGTIKKDSPAPRVAKKVAPAKKSPSKKVAPAKKDQPSGKAKRQLYIF